MERQAQATNVIIEHTEFGFGVIYYNQKGREYVEKNYKLDETVTLETTLRLLKENENIFWDCDSKTFDTIKCLFPDALRYSNYVGEKDFIIYHLGKDNLAIKFQKQNFSIGDFLKINPEVFNFLEDEEVRNFTDSRKFALDLRKFSLSVNGNKYNNFQKDLESKTFVLYDIVDGGKEAQAESLHKDDVTINLPIHLFLPADVAVATPYIKENVLIKSMNETFTSCLDTAKKKNNDYGGTNTDPFYNFETSSLMSGVPVPDGMMVRMSDKWSRVKTLLKRENLVLDESIGDTIDDLINYLAILKAYIQQKNKEN